MLRISGNGDYFHGTKTRGKRLKWFWMTLSHLNVLGRRMTPSHLNILGRITQVPIRWQDLPSSPFFVTLFSCNALSLFPCPSSLFPVFPCPISPFLVFPCPISPCPVFPCPISPCAPSFFLSSRLVLSCLFLCRFVPSCLIRTCHSLSRLFPLYHFPYRFVKHC